MGNRKIEEILKKKKKKKKKRGKERIEKDGRDSKKMQIADMKESWIWFESIHMGEAKKEKQEDKRRDRRQYGLCGPYNSSNPINIT